MLVYRVFPYLSTASDAGVQGHPMHLHKPQGHGRWDNPLSYDTWYFAKAPECAVGETFGNLTEWSDDMFDFPIVPGSRRTLGVFDLPDDLPVIDLDDAKMLLDRGIRPSKVVSPNRSHTQAMALSINDEFHAHGPRMWSGIQWWSSWRSHWEVVVAFVQAGDDLPHELVKIEHLDITHPAVVVAAHTLRRAVV